MSFNYMQKDIARKIKAARSIVLTTHRHCDGDGLGAQIALYHALKKSGKKVRVLNVDDTPKKYSFLETDSIVQAFEGAHDAIKDVDLALVFDTNDHRLLEPLFSDLRKRDIEVLFIDHHPVLKKGPEPTKGSWIDESAASTGELVFALIKELEIPFDAKIARALYTSIVFDTQLFRFIRSSPQTHLITAELLKHNIGAEEIHRRLFSNYSPEKIALLARALNQVEYFHDGKIAFLKLKAQDFKDVGLDSDASRDVIDFLMNIETLEAAVILREDDPSTFKLSLRSKGRVEISPVAEQLGGGGHPFSAGATLKGSYETVKEKVLHLLKACLSGRKSSNYESA